MRKKFEKLYLLSTIGKDQLKVPSELVLYWNNDQSWLNISGPEVNATFARRGIIIIAATINNKKYTENFFEDKSRNLGL